MADEVNKNSQRARPTEAELRERHLNVLRAFVYRARRVEYHSITRDAERLKAFSKGSMTLEISGSTNAVVQQLPSEEALESLGARVRPMILQKEITHYSAVMGALKAFAKEDAEVLAGIVDLKRLWHRLRPDNPNLLAWSAQVMVAPGADVETQTDIQLAYAWLYGDVVHGDQDRLADARSFGRDERFRAAVLVIANLATVTMYTYNLLRNMRQRNLLQIDESYFDELVEITETEYRRDAQVAVGPHGAVPPELGHSWGSEWTAISHPPGTS